jgi:hypothetical protein
VVRKKESCSNTTKKLQIVALITMILAAAKTQKAKVTIRDNDIMPIA